MTPLIGRVHSIETLGMRDGPGLRCVFFMAGCNYRCRFCQNADTWTAAGSQRMTLQEARERLLPLLPYLRQQGGGITVSGGEPCLQAEFVLALFQLAHELGLNTALDTNGSCSSLTCRSLIEASDLVMLDIKASTDKLHRWVTGQPLAPVLRFGRWAAEAAGRLLVRRVLLPGINDTPEELQNLTDYLLSLPHKPEVELIAYHRLGVHKWKELGVPYTLGKLKPPSMRQWEKAAHVLSQKGIKVMKG